MGTIHKPTTASLLNGTMKFHLRAAKAFEQLGNKENAARANKAAKRLQKVINNL